MQPISKYAYRVQHMDVGFQEKLRCVKLGNYLLHAAGLHANDNGFGVDVLTAENRAWVLSRFAVEMNRYPVAGEAFAVETWIENFERVFTTRNFRVTDADDVVIGSGTTIWCLIDIQERKAVDFGLKPDYKPFATGIPSLIGGVKKVAELNSEPISRHRIKYSDIDFNRHTNSMKYIEWMLDLLPMSYYVAKQVKRMDVQFVREALYGEVVDVLTDQPQPDCHVFGLKREGETVCKASFLFENVV